MKVLSRQEWPEKFGPRTDLTGKRVGKWLVLGLTRKSPTTGKWQWAVACQDCPWSSVSEVAALDLNRGTTQGCSRCRQPTGGGTHGDSKHPVYGVWSAMLSRCSNPNDTDYVNYGGRGITVCERWRKYEGFRDDMKASYQKGLMLERVDNDGPYSPENCRWATKLEQANNTRTNVMIRWGEQVMSLPNWARAMGLGADAVRNRINWQGWPLRRALTEGADPSAPVPEGEPVIVSRGKRKVEP